MSREIIQLAAGQGYAVYCNTNCTLYPKLCETHTEAEEYIKEIQK